jgi:putative NIF3 family GTP cyclohydrolase 1 type 2
VSEGVSVYSPHTALDSCVGGINDWLCKTFPPGRTAPIKPLPLLGVHGQEGAGSGRIHLLDYPIQMQKLVKLVKDYLGLEKVRFASGGKEQVQSIAVCAGSGTSVS